MSRKTRFLFFGLLAVVVLSVLFNISLLFKNSRMSQLESEIQDMKSVIQKKDSVLGEMNKMNDLLKSEYDSSKEINKQANEALDKQLSELKKDTVSLNRKITTLNEEVVKQKNQIAALSAEVSKLKKNNRAKSVATRPSANPKKG